MRCRHVRLVVGTLGGQHGAASHTRKWNYLHAGITIWLSQSTATGWYNALPRLSAMCFLFNTFSFVDGSLSVWAHLEASYTSKCHIVMHFLSGFGHYNLLLIRL